MLIDLTITITQAELWALERIAVDPVEWITNFTKVRAAAAMQEIYERELARMLADPKIKTIPADRDKIIRDAKIPSAAERQAEFLANPPEARPPDGI